MAVSKEPDRRLLADFLLGRLAPPESERVAVYLQAHPEAQDVAAVAEVEDPLLSLVRRIDEGAPLPASPAVDELIGRLTQLHPTVAADTTTDADGHPTGPGGARGADHSFLRPPEEADELGRLGGYRVLEVLGQGGMGIVFRALDPALQRHIALKVMLPARAASADFRARFLREARAAAALQHDHVIAIYQVGEDNGAPFIAMPHLAGETLEDRLRRAGRLPIGEVLRIGREAAEGLAAAHAVGVIHRDVKPANIWLESLSGEQGGGSAGRAGLREHPESGRAAGLVPAGVGERGGVSALREVAGRVKLLDFGLARSAEGEEGVTAAGALLGTPAYMSPEQADGLPLDARSDLFSLGCVLYRTLTGTAPFRGATTTATLRAVAEHHPPPPHEADPLIPPGLSLFVMRLLAKSPADRPASAREVAAALRDLEQPGSTVEYRPAMKEKPRRWIVPAVAAAVVLLVAGLGMLLVPKWMQPAPDMGQPAASAYQGSVDVLVWTTADGTSRRMRLDDDGALPLRPGDQFRIEAKVSPAACLYLFWIDTEGKAAPIYPWSPGKWGTRPAEESLREELSLPPTLSRGYKISGDRAGMETLLLLTRPTPLDAGDDVVQSWFAGVSPQRPVQNARSAVWFENGLVVQHDARRKRQWFEESDINDPVLRMQELLRERLSLQPHAALTTAVSFAKQGK